MSQPGIFEVRRLMFLMNVPTFIMTFLHPSLPTSPSWWGRKAKILAHVAQHTIKKIPVQQQ